MDSQEATTSTVPGTTVLVVEDDMVAVAALQSLLTHYGYRVLVATTVKKAIALLALRPQIVLLDLMLPDGDGTQVMEAIKARKLTTHVAVVTAVIESDRLRKVCTYGPQQLLRKPLDFLSLLQKLRQHIGQNAA